MSDINDKADTGNTHMTTQIKGKPQPISMEMTRKWLAADCGDVTPRAMPAK